MSQIPLAEDTAASLTRLQEIASDVLREAQARGASSAEVTLSSSAGLSVNVRLGEVETVEHNRDKALGVTVYFGHRKGSASTTDFSPGAVTESVAAACAIARHTAEDRYAGLADAERLAVDPPELALHYHWDLTPEQAIELATECETAARDVDARIINSDGAAVNRAEGVQVYGNTHGFLAGYASSRHSLSCTVIAGDEQGMQRDYWYSVARNPTELEAAVDIGRRAASRSLRRLGARKIATASVPVLYAAELAPGLLGHFVSAIRGGNLYRKASFLIDHLGKQVFPAHVCLREQPHLPGAVGSRPFDAEGVATRDREVVDAGVLQGYVLSSYSARRLGMQSTGNAGGVHNLTATPGPGEPDLEALMKTMDRGLYVTELMGMGINIVTGDYSRGAAGFWVENGAISHPVEEITIAGNLRDMFMGIVATGTDIERRGTLRCGSVLIEGMTVAGS